MSRESRLDEAYRSIPASIMPASTPNAPSVETPKMHAAIPHFGRERHCRHIQAGGASFIRYDRGRPGGEYGGLQ